jgi:UDP-2,3-diacylglucosamine pyrophosphatase LpxH
MAKPPRKLKVIISDFHIGTGKRDRDGEENVGEDFHHDDDFIDLLDSFIKQYPRGGDVELIINGDFLNFLYVGYRGTFPMDVTEAISEEKLALILGAHPQAFDALMRFAKHKGFRIAYIIGNHDMDMIWPACQALFQKRLNAHIEFYPLEYVFDGIHVEHGNRFELFNKFDYKNPILTRGVKSPVLNQPFGSFFVDLFAGPLKKEKPHIDKIKPFRVFLILDFLTHFRSALGMLIRFLTFFAVMLFHPYRKRYPTLRSTLQVIINGISMFPNIERGAKSLLRTHANIHTVIFGHNHVAKVLQYRDQKRYLNSGTWNEITSLDLAHFGKRDQRTYIEITYLEDEALRPVTKLKIWLGQWNPTRTVT